jgi:hypothetical protein
VTNNICPFKAGDVVVYRPSLKGRDHVLMTKLSELKPGESYRIARIAHDYYVVLEGFEDDPGGGLYWTEFSQN